jgi:sugar/nucleoside kinase (ribokinase family)
VGARHAEARGRYLACVKLVVTGTIGIDTVYTPRDRREGVPGGSAAYFAAAASFFAPVRVVAAVGADWPDEHRRVLEGFQGLCLQGLEQRAGSRTFAWGGRYEEDVNIRHTLFTEVGVLQEEPPRAPADYADSALVFLGNTHPSVQASFIEQFPARKLVVADTMDLWITTAHAELRELIRRVNGIIINDSEACQLTGFRNAVSAGKRILEMGPTFAVVKKGEHGCVLVHRDGIAALPAFPLDEHHVVDPTGAGDSFAGAMMGHLSRAGSIDFHAVQGALASGTVVASFTIESFGLERLRSLRGEEISERMERFRHAARVG